MKALDTTITTRIPACGRQAVKRVPCKEGTRPLNSPGRCGASCESAFDLGPLLNLEEQLLPTQISPLFSIRSSIHMPPCSGSLENQVGMLNDPGGLSSCWTVFAPDDFKQYEL